MKIFMLLVLVCIGAWVLLATVPCWATGTTEVQIVKYANDATTVLNETTVNYEWMMNNLPVYGDGVTHYYHQGPIFQEEWEEIHPNETWDRERDKWNPEEDVNVLTKDLGAVKGTNVKDLCELVGGMAEGDTVEIKAVDGFFKRFPYENVYMPEPRQGPLVVTWYTKDATESGHEEGYVADGYYNGMRLVFFADTSTNLWGKHVFGIADMHECIPEEYWHYYQYPDYPTTTGFTVKYVNRIYIHSTLEPPVLTSIAVLPADVTLEIGGVQQFNATPYQYGNEMPNILLTWTSSDVVVGTVDETGLFLAKGVGTVTVSATNETVTGTATVTVQNGRTGDSNGGSGGSSAKYTPTPTPSSSVVPTETAVTEASRFVPLLKAGEEVAMSFTPLVVSVITLRSVANASEVSVTVEHVEESAVFPPPPGIAYRYLEITVESAESAQIGGTIEFMVAKSWIEEEGIGTVLLISYDEEQGWTALPTSKVGEDATVVYYEANVAEFSLFAIAGEEKSETTSETPSPSLTTTVTPLATITPTPTVAMPRASDRSYPPEEPGTLLPGFEASLCGISIVALYAYKRRKKKRCIEK